MHLTSNPISENTWVYNREYFTKVLLTPVAKNIGTIKIAGCTTCTVAGGEDLVDLSNLNC